MIIKAALLLFRETEAGKQLLFVRAQGKPYLIFPGGKQEVGETVEQALQRELQEELGTTASDVAFVGIVDGDTPDGRPLKMHLYTGRLQAEPVPHSEIEELIWLSKSEIGARTDVLTPITIGVVLPYLTERNVW